MSEDVVNVSVRVGVRYRGVIREHELLPTQRMRVRHRYESVITKHLEALRAELNGDADVTFLIEDHR